MAHIVFVDCNKRSIRAMTLARQLGHRVTFIHNEDHRVYLLSPVSRKLLGELEDVICISSTVNPEVLEPAMREVHRREPVDAVICLYEFAVDSVAEVCRRLGLPFTDAAAARLARRKDAVRQRLAELGIPSARFAVIEPSGAFAERALEVAGDFGFPIVMKPASGADSMLAQVIRNEGEAAAYVQAFAERLEALPVSIRSQFGRGILIEEFLVGPLVSVEIARARNGTTLPYMVSGRRCGQLDPTVELSFIMPAALTTEARNSCIAYAQRVLDAVGLDFGFFHIEMIVTASGPRLVEINPRMMGGNMPLLYDNLTGASLFEHLIEIHLGGQPQVPEIPHDAAVASVRFKTREAGVVSRDMRADWLADFGSRIVVSYLDVEPAPGLKVEKGFNFGGLQVRGRTSDEVNDTAAQVLLRFEELTSVQIER